LLELVEAGLAAPGLVVAEEGEDDVGLAAGQPLVGRAEAVGALAVGELVAGEAEVAEDEVVLGEATVEVGFQPAVVLHAVGKGVPDEADVVAGVDLEPGGGLRRIGGVERQAGGEDEGEAGEGQRREQGEPAARRRGTATRHGGSASGYG